MSSPPDGFSSFALRQVKVPCFQHLSQEHCKGGWPERVIVCGSRFSTDQNGCVAGADTARLLNDFSDGALVPNDSSEHSILPHDGECSATLKWKVEFDSPVDAIVKYLRVLIAAFERQVKTIDRHLNQRAGLDRIEILAPHACEVPTKVGGTATLFALVDQPGGSEAAPDKTIQIRV